jgi:hypothetical protein
MATLFDDLETGGGDLYFDNLNSAPITGDEPAIFTIGALRFLGSAVITGDRFGSSQGAGHVTIGGVSQPILSWANGSITIGPIARGALRYGTQNVVVTSDADGSSNPSSQPFLPQTGWDYVNLVNPLATTGDRITTTPDLAAGFQVAWGNVLPSGAATVYSNAAFTVSGTVGSFDAECNDLTGWGGFGTQVVAAVAAFSGALTASPARIQGAFTVGAQKAFGGSLNASPATLSGSFLAFRARTLAGELIAGDATIQGAFLVVGRVTPTTPPVTPVPGTGTEASKVAIFNAALVKLGQSTPIQRFGEDSKAGRLAPLVYDRVRDRELEKHIWKFAIYRKNMPEVVSDEPRGGYRYTFPKPVDWLKTIWIGHMAIGSQLATSDADQADWSHEGENILANIAPPLPLHYVRRISDPTKYSSLFIEVLACALAMECADSLTGSLSRWERARAEYDAAISSARRENAVVDPPRPQQVDSWISARD